MIKYILKKLKNIKTKIYYNHFKITITFVLK